MFWFGVIILVSVSILGFFLWPEIKKIRRDEETLDRGRENIAAVADNVSYSLVAGFYKAIHFLAVLFLTILRYATFYGKVLSGKLEKRFSRLLNLIKGKEPWHNKKGSVSVFLRQIDGK